MIWMKNDSALVKESEPCISKKTSYYSSVIRGSCISTYFQHLAKSVKNEWRELLTEWYFYFSCLKNGKTFEITSFFQYYHGSKFGLRRELKNSYQPF